MPKFTDGDKQILASGYGTGLPPKQKEALRRPYSTGSLQLNDGDDIKDASGDDRITVTDAGSLILKDESGNAGITLTTDQSTTFANHITASGNISGSSTSNITIGGKMTADNYGGNVSGSSISTGSFGRVQTSDGSEFGNRFILSTQTIAAAGSDQSGATAIDADGGSTVFVTDANDAKGVRLPVVAQSSIGQKFTIINTVSNKTLEVFPGSGDKILPARDNAAITVGNGQTLVVIHYDADGGVGYEPAAITA